MKKILLSFGLVALLSLAVKAQHFVTSFGVELGWNIPNRVTTVIHHDFYDYHMVHVTRSRRFGASFFDIILQRGNVFVEVSVRNDGFIYSSATRFDYPLVNHVCGHGCGYHSGYYAAYYNTCSSHHHHGHNHIMYNYDRPYYGYGNRYYGHKRYVNRNVHIEQRNNVSNRKDRTVNQRRKDNDQYTRRDRYHDEQVNDSRNRKSRVVHQNTRRRTRSGE